MHLWQQGRARKRVTAFCSNIVVTIDVPGKYFIEIARSLTSRTSAGPLTLIQENSRIDARDLYLRRDFNRSRQRDDIVRERIPDND